MIRLCKDLIISIIHNQYSLRRILNLIVGNLIDWILGIVKIGVLPVVWIIILEFPLHKNTPNNDTH